MFATYYRSNNNKTEDLVVVKERLYNPSTKQEKPNLKLVRNYRRTFGITKKEFRTHEQKKEWEHISRLDMYECTSAEMPRKMAKLLGNPSFTGLRDSCASPYTYGADITSSVLYKQKADKRAAATNGGWNPESTMAVMDFETDMVHGTEYIISGAVTFKDKAVIAVTEDFIRGVATAEDIQDKVLSLCHEHLREDMEKRKINLKVIVCKNDFEVVARLMKAVHVLKPDFLVFWNSGFDIKKMIEACQRNGVNPADVFCDPSIPPEFRSFEFVESKANKTSTSGRKMNFGSADMWHVIKAPASFYVIDAMAVFKLLRVAEGMRRSYSLDAILEDELGIRKLEYNAPEAQGNHNVSWHRAMQKYHKLIYLVYNLFDCISVELLDEKEGDLSRKISLYADGSEYSTLKSNPKRLANALHFYLEEEGKLICTTSKNMSEAMDKYVLGKRDWIVTLPNELTYKHGAMIWDPEHAGDLLSRIAIHVYDIDITSGYPSGQWALNACRATTLVEVCAIAGIMEQELRRFAVNTTNIPSNAIDMGHTMLGLPNVKEALEEYTRHIAANDQSYLGELPKELLTTLAKAA